MPPNKKIFLSIVSSEFMSYRVLLSSDLKRPNLDVAVQEDFAVLGRTTLEKLDEYIRQCDAVIHLIGKATGGVPEEPAIAALLATYADFSVRLPPLAEYLRKPQPGFSYTQWEAYLAIYHVRPLFVYRPTDFGLDALDVPRDGRFTFDAAEVQSQREHYQRIGALGHDRGQFLNQERLSSAVLRDLVEILPRLESSTRVDVSHFDVHKYAPIKLIGRETETALLNDAWAKVQSQETKRPHILTFVALGGEGKTSLVAKWAADLAHQSWPGCDAVFAWSFYSQGTREQNAASSDLFLAEALTFFGDAAMAGSDKGAFNKGRRLAYLVGERRALLILDGLEPLQYAPTSPTASELKDQGLAALLNGLAANSHGLCVVTTRYTIPDLRAFLGKTAQEEMLMRLSTEAGVELLQSLDVKGSLQKSIPSADGRALWNEYEKLVEDVKGHALTLNLLGSYLRDAHAGDIRQRDLIKLVEADAEVQGGHAFRVMDAYVQSFESSGKTAEDHAKGRRALALLQLLGLFDRPATVDCLKALWQAPAITGLTEPLIGISEAQRNLSLQRLEDARLLTVNRDVAGTLLSLDAHPLIREYFAARVRNSDFSQSEAGGPAKDGTTSEAWRAAHRRLYGHLCATTPDKSDATLEDLQPLYQAVAHGCHAGLQQEVYDTVCEPRIWRRKEVYTVRKLGAFGSDLGAITCFFEQPWSRLSPLLTEANQASILNRTGFCLRALGRLTEAIEPVRMSTEIAVKLKKWKDVASSYGELSELELLLGEVAEAVQDAEQSVTHAGRSGDAIERMFDLTVLATALHQAGRRKEAEARFQEAEQMQADRQPTYPLLYSLQGFLYCELFLTEAERAAWQRFVVPPLGGQGRPSIPEPCKCMTTNQTLAANCRAVSERAAQTLKWEEGMQDAPLLDIPLHHLTLSRAALYEALLEYSDIENSQSEIDAAVSGLRDAGQQQYLPLALLTRAWLRSLTGFSIGPENAQSDLDEAWEIAERGSMKLYMADIHLYRARLFFFYEQQYPWQSPQDDLAAAEKLIKDCGYHRRDEELADAKQAILG
jgi:tetratricopeptide (TPR) repeat protein